MIRLRLLFSCAFLLLIATQGSVAQVRRALLIGINTYQPSQTTAQHPAGCTGGRCDLPIFENLDGALNDVAAMRDLLVSPRFGFAPASRFGILPPQDWPDEAFLALGLNDATALPQGTVRYPAPFNID